VANNPIHSGSPDDDPVIPDPAYLRPYREAVQSFGASSFEATLWNSREKQVRRFEVIAEMVNLHGRVVLDAGCGVGDFAAFMNEREIQYARYIGLEALEPVAVEARKRGIDEASFEVVDFARDVRAFEQFKSAPGVDVIVFSGSLNTLDEFLVMQVLERAWAAAKEMLVFNFLSTRHAGSAGQSAEPARRFDPIRMLDWALEKTARVQFRQEYFDGHDATVGMGR